jgi:hypothetical protein
MAQRGLALAVGRLPEEAREPGQVGPDLRLLLGVVGDVLGVLRVNEERPEHVQLHRAALARLVRKLFVGTTSGQIAVRCGGRSSAIRTCVIPANEEPTVPTRPFDQRCSAIHSTVS